MFLQATTTSSMVAKYFLFFRETGSRRSENQIRCNLIPKTVNRDSIDPKT